jgi:hypothetical protein
MATPAAANAEIIDNSGIVRSDSSDAAPGNPGSGLTVEAKWNLWCVYSSEQTGSISWTPGSTVTVVRERDLTIDEVISKGWGLSGTYGAYRVDCRTASGRGYVGGRYWWTETPPRDPVDIRTDVAARITITPPEVQTSPPFDRLPAIVQLPTWLWVTDTWDVKHEHDTVGYLRVDVWARPDTVTWTFTDGTTITCNGPGTPYYPGGDTHGSDCAHTFTTTSANQPNSVHTATASINWIFSWAMNGQDQGDFGTVNPPTTFTIEVAEIHALER